MVRRGDAVDIIDGANDKSGNTDGIIADDTGGDTGDDTGDDAGDDIGGDTGDDTGGDTGLWR